MITNIAIKDFRSLANVDVSANWLTTFVGSNDAGKSNVLRALNLFFNGQTDHNVSLDFRKDYNQFAAKRKNKAQQIEITLTIELPESYQRDGCSPTIEWRKVWRDSGEVPRLGFRRFSDGQEFPSRSKIPALLDRYLFSYIPAIKDREFFGDLQGRLYDVLSSVAEQPLKDSALVFEDQLQEQLQELLEAINSEFDSNSKMKLPENLREIFENLEISADGVPLSRRGDGIKIRHIPMMLKFISIKRDQLLNKGGVKYTHIWGFEEPENNVEMSAAFEMAEEMGNLIEWNDNVQIFLTTHSPIFYRMDELGADFPSWVTTHFVSKSQHTTALSQKDPDEVDESMGLMPIVAPYVREAKAKHSAMVAAVAEAKALQERQKPTVFLEGETDQKVIEIAWDMFATVDRKEVHFHCGDGDYGSANAVASRVLAWLLETRHKPVEQRKRAFAIFDRDAAGAAAYKKLKEDIDALNLGNLPRRIILMPVPKSLQPLRRNGYEIPIDLEALLTDAAWAVAKGKGWLEKRSNLHSLLSDRLMAKIFNREVEIASGLSESEKLRIECSFSEKGKAALSRYLGNLPRDEQRSWLEGFRPIISEIEERIH